MRDVRTFGGLIDLHEKIDLGLSTAATGHTDARLKRRISVADIASVLESSTIRSTEYPTSGPWKTFVMFGRGMTTNLPA